MKFILLLTMFADAQATVRPHTFTCDIIRAYVAMYGEEAAEKWAKKKKWSAAKIGEARACLR